MDVLICKAFYGQEKGHSDTKLQGCTEAKSQNTRSESFIQSLGDVPHLIINFPRRCTND